MQKLVKFALAIALVATCSAGVNAGPEYSKVSSRMALLSTSKSLPQYSPIIKTLHQCGAFCCGQSISGGFCQIKIVAGVPVAAHATVLPYANVATVRAGAARA